MTVALSRDQPAVGKLVHRIDALVPLPGGQPCACRACQRLGTGLDRGRRWRLPSDDDDPRHLTETVDAGYRAVVQPFDVAWQRTDGLDLREMRFCATASRMPGAASRASRCSRACMSHSARHRLARSLRVRLIFSCTSVPQGGVLGEPWLGAGRL